MSKGHASKAAQAEHRATGKAARARDRQPVALLGTASEIADQPPLIAISLATLAAGAILRRPATTRAGLRMLVSHGIATGAKALLKNAVDRSRPARAQRDGGAHVGTSRGATDSELNSFPSGHTAGAVSVAQALAHEFPATAPHARAGAAAIGAVQLPRGAYYISDVIAGAAIGWAAERLAGLLLHAGERSMLGWRARRAERRALAEAEAHPS